MSPRAVLKRPTILPRRPQDGLEEVFFSHLSLSSIWFCFGIYFFCHLGPLLGTQIGHFGDRFLDDFCMSFQDRPKSGQERPKSRQEPPKSLPRAPKSGQGPPKSLPRAPKSGPRVVKRALRAAKSEPRGPKSGKN